MLSIPIVLFIFFALPGIVLNYYLEVNKTSEDFVANNEQVSALMHSAKLDKKLIYDLINLEREKLNLSTLLIDLELEKAATEKAKHICKHQYWAHISPEGVEPWDFVRDFEIKYSIAGENLARDFESEHLMVSNWMASKLHKDNIVNPNYKFFGIGIEECVLQGVQTQVVVNLFTSPPVDYSPGAGGNMSYDNLDPETPVHF